MVFYDLDFFAGFTSINLFLMSIIVFTNIKLTNKNQIFSLLLIFLVGMLSEFIGVNYGLIFGEYTYGNNLGFKLFGVPLLIGLNWVILTVICANIASILIKNNSILLLSCLYIYLLFNSMISLDFDLGAKRNFGFICFSEFILFCNLRNDFLNSDFRKSFSLTHTCIALIKDRSPLGAVAM